MNEEEKQPDKQQGSKFDWLKATQWQKGQSGNPKGRPKEKTLKEFARHFLANLSDEDRVRYLSGVDPKTIWEMAEGKPKQDLDITANLTIATVLDQLENGRTTIEQRLETLPPVSDTGQTKELGTIQQEQSTEALPSKQVEQEYNPQE